LFHVLLYSTLDVWFDPVWLRFAHSCLLFVFQKAGAGLFDWRNDRKLLFGAHTQSTPKAEEQHYQDHVESGGGSQQFVFRILKKEKPDAVENNIPGPWWRHLKQTFPALAGVEDTASQAECGGEAPKACCSLQ
jgi:hypothetical protein